MSKHWPGACKLRVQTPQKLDFFVQWGVKKVTENEEGKKGGRRGEKDRNMGSNREPKADKNGVKNEAEQNDKKKRRQKRTLRRKVNF